mmetsp:Transcript_11323/g.21594  ORF Transcript_11323/g.21594 Transcript_11323/m.21594 type:complete len:345 (+) Transcript_11323:126-1160(+)|eukprot:scaffold1564_cov174-Amphora_coffeaeformis.AAC.6
MLPSALLSRLGSASGALTDRQRARFTSERVSAEEDGAARDAPASPVSLDDTTSLVAGEATSTANNNDSPTSSSNNNHGGNENHPEEDDRGEEDDLEAGHNHEESRETSQGGGNDNVFYRTTMTLAELEEERELARRRMSACVLLTVFVLFKLWIDCIEEPSLPLLMVCLIGTSWTARWIRYNREREEELDRRIAQYLQSNNNNHNHTDGEGVMDRNDLRMLSFQAQLALAIMESQRHMMEGGRPDSENQDPGVSEAAKGHWETIKFHDDSAQYGSVKEVDGPHCSICLCEYEEGDQLTKLPCQHLYHQECIDSWTEHHTKCPLCNMDLESVSEGSASLAESNIV